MVNRPGLVQNAPAIPQIQQFGRVFCSLSQSGRSAQAAHVECLLGSCAMERYAKTKIKKFRKALRERDL
jgi:hypothetical protein